MQIKNNNSIKNAEPFLLINIDNLKDNLAAIESYVAPAKIMAVIKSDAYGHGLLQIANYLKDKVACFLLDRVKDSIILRRQGITTPLFVGTILPDEIDSCCHYNLEWSLGDWQMLLALEQFLSNNISKKVSIHLKIDSGMGRYGFEVEEYESVLNKLVSFKNLTIKAVYSHLAISENKQHPFNQEQIKKFQTIINLTKQKKIALPLFHLANSGAIINFKETHLDLVRTGLLLYGAYHFTKKLPIKLKPVLSLHSRLTSVKTIPKGRSVSYSLNWRAKERCNIAFIPFGYGDALSWQFSNKLEVIIQDKKYPIIGNICMGISAINLGKDSYELGEKVTIIGETISNKISVEDLAEKGVSISHEILTSLSKIGQRNYI